MRAVDCTPYTRETFKDAQVSKPKQGHARPRSKSLILVATVHRRGQGRRQRKTTRKRQQFFLFWPATSPSTSKQNKRQPNVCRSWLPLPLVQRCILQSGTSHWCHDSTAHHELLSSKAKTSPPTQRQTLGSHPMSSGSIATTHAILLPAVGFHCQPFLARYYNIDDGGPRKAKTMHVKVLDLLGHCRLPINFRRMPTALRSTCRPTRLYHDVTAEFVMRIQHDVLYQDT